MQNITSFQFKTLEVIKIFPLFLRTYILRASSTVFLLYVILGGILMKPTKRLPLIIDPRVSEQTLKQIFRTTLCELICSLFAWPKILGISISDDRHRTFGHLWFQNEPLSFQPFCLFQGEKDKKIQINKKKRTSFVLEKLSNFSERLIFYVCWYVFLV